MDLVDSTILLLAVWLMGIAGLDIPKTTKQQQKYQKMVISNMTDVKILTECRNYSVMANLTCLQIMMWCHTTNIFCTNMIATSMLNCSLRACHSAEMLL